MLKIGGSNLTFQTGEKSNGKDITGNSVIYPPVNSSLKVPLVTSYSTYMDHSVVIFKNGNIFAIGNNSDYRIINSLPKRVLKEYTRYDIKSSSGHTWNPISSVCGQFYTLYLVSVTKDSDDRKLVYSRSNLVSDFPLFLNTGHSNPISLFGGRSNAAAVNSDGSILFIPESICLSSSELIKPIFLPGIEKVVSVACLDDVIACLAMSGRTYFASVKKIQKEEKAQEEEEEDLVFIAVINSLDFVSVDSILNGMKIVCLSGTFHHCLCANEDGLAFSFGQNGFGELGIGEGIENDNFVEIVALNSFKIKAVYAGSNHSFFQTYDGKILACGSSCCGELMSRGPSEENVYLPIETGIEKDATFCVVGSSISAVFIGCDPVNSPNRKIPDSSHSLHDLLSNAEKEIKQLKEEVSRLKKERNENEFKKHEVIHSNLPKKLQLFEQKTINELNVIESIGRGADSEVFKVSRQENLALKVLNIPKNGNENSSFIQMKRFFQEYEILHNLNHPNIINSFGFCFGDKSHPPSILLRFCPKNLNQIVTEMNEIQRICTIFEISVGMEAVHSAKLIHRDLKPANILIDEEGHVKISDFGVSCIVDIENQTLSMTAGVGTLKFMAPELLNECTHYNNKVDVYSFGVVVFFILTGGEMPKITMGEQASGKKAKLPDCLNEMAKFLISECWENQPEKRPSFEQIVEFIKENNFMLIDGVEKKIEKIKSFLAL